MKRRFLFITLVLMIGISLIGCERYNPEDADRITAKGTGLIWQKLSNGDYVLASEKNEASEYFSHAGKLDRAE